MSRVVAEARRWIGTPYLHRGAQRGAGCDCLGLVRGIWRDLQGEAVIPPAYAPDGSTGAAGELLWQALGAHMVSRPRDRPVAGDVLLIRLRDNRAAAHLAVQSCTIGAGKIIHAYGRHGVVESPLCTAWHRRITARFAFPQKEV